MTDLPLAPATPPVNEPVEAQEDRILTDLLAKKPEPEAPEAPAAKEDEQPEPAEDADAGDAVESADELEKAITSLRRGKIPQTVLKKMSNREILAMSKDMIERQAEADNTYRELGELRKKAKELESRQESRANAEPAPEQPSTNDLAAELALLTEGLGPDTAKALEAFVKKHVAGGGKKYDAEIQSLRGELSSASSLVERMLTKEIRGDLRERFPDVDDAAKWDKVKDKAATLAKTGDYAQSEDPMRDVFEDAARLILKPAAPATPPKTESRAKSLGQPASKSRQTPPAALSPEDREDAALSVLLKGGSREKAKEAYGG